MPELLAPALRTAPIPAERTPRPMHRRVHDIAILSARVLLLLVVAVAPWLFGGVESAVQQGICWAVLAAIVCWSVALATEKPCCLAVPVTAVPLLCAVLFGILQTVPLSRPVLEFVSPHAAAHWGRVLSDAEYAPLSLYPASTRYDVSLLGLATAVFVLGSQLFASRAALRWLWGLVAVNGAALSLFGLVQQLLWNGKLYWLVEPVQVTKAFGPYVNHNNAGGYLNMCLAGALTWLLVSRSSRDPQEIAPGGIHADACVPALWRLGMALPAGLILAGIVASLSRGAFVSLLAGVLAVVFAARFVRRAPGHIRPIGLAALVATAVVFACGLSDGIRGRLGSLADQVHSPDERLLHWRDASTAIPDYWLAGSGLGTYRYLYRWYDRREGDEWFYHAENQYLEALIEGGVVGGGLMLLVLVLIVAAAWRTARSEFRGSGKVLALAALFALVTQIVHAGLDFGLYLPANMLLFALICGTVAGRALRWRPDGSTRWPLLSLPSGPATAVVALTLAMLSGFTLLETSTLAAFDSARDRWNALDRRTPLPVREAALQRLAEAARRRWDDADLQQSLARCHLDLYRRTLFENLKQRRPHVPPDALWPLTTTEKLGEQVRKSAAAGRQQTLEAIRRSDVVGDYVAPAYAHLQLARRACPLLPQVDLRLAELCPLFEPADVLPRYLEPLSSVARSLPETGYRAGVLLFEAGRTDAAFRLWRESLTASPRYAADVVALARQRVGLKTLIEEAFPTSPRLLVELARDRFPAASSPDMHALLLEAARSLDGAAADPLSRRLSLPDVGRP